MKRNTSCKLVELLHPPYNAHGWQFFELLSQPFPQKRVNMRTTESLCSRFDVTSGPRPRSKLIETSNKNLNLQNEKPKQNFCGSIKPTPLDKP